MWFVHEISQSTKRESLQKQIIQNDPLPCDPRVDRVGHTWTEGLCPRVAHVALTWDTRLAILAELALSRTRRVLRQFSGL